MNPADYQYFHGVPMPIEPTMLDTVVQLIERLGVSIAVVIMSFYYMLTFVILKDNKYLAFFIVSHLFASMFRIEYIFILPFILFYYLTNNHHHPHLNPH